MKELEDEIKEINAIEEEKKEKLTTEETTSEITPVTENDQIIESCITDEIESNKQIKNTDSAINKKASGLKKRKMKLSKKRPSMCLTCNTNEQSQIVPQCIWYQNKNYIYLKFNILEMDNDFSVNSTVQSIIFK